MKPLPAISDPSRYLGLFVFDFGDHVAVGYTAGEIDTLRAMPEYRSGTPYQVYRIHENGGFELRGMGGSPLSVREAMCFLRAEGAAARRDYDAIVRAAEKDAIPVEAELRLLRSYSFDPPDLTALVYPAHASHLISAWLTKTTLSPGDRVEAGSNLVPQLDSGAGLTVKSSQLLSAATSDRSRQELLDCIHNPLQR